jgi:methionyl-tRNA formyltransferase
MHSPAPKVWAKENNIKYLQPEKLSEIENELNGFNLFIVIAYGKIIPEKIINLPKFGTINLHYSLLPAYRGASPVESAILNGDTETGITIQQMVYKLDAGNILFQEKIEILETETTTELRNRLNTRAIEIFPEFLENLFTNSPDSAKAMSGKQNESQATTCGKFTKEDFNVTNEYEQKDFKTLYRKYKAFDKKIYFFYKEKRIKITEMNSDEIIKVLPESRKEITYPEFLRNF